MTSVVYVSIVYRPYQSCITPETNSCHFLYEPPVTLIVMILLNFIHELQLKPFICLLRNIACSFACLLICFSLPFFLEKKSVKNASRVFGSNQARHFVILSDMIWVQTICKCYQRQQNKSSLEVVEITK